MVIVFATTSAGLTPKMPANSQAWVSDSANFPDLYLLKFD
jgi:hypothetical protein